MFLRDWCEHLKQNRPELSQRELCRRAGLSNGYLPSLFRNQIGLTKKAFRKLHPHLFLGKKRTTFFELLRTVGEARSDRDRMSAFKKIQLIYREREKNSPPLETYRYMSQWYYVAIREMVQMDEFRFDPKWIQKRLSNSKNKTVSLNEIKTALDYLTQEGFIKASSGKQTLSAKPFKTDGDFFKLSLHQFHRQMLEIEKEAIYDIPREQRNLMSYTIALSSKKFEKLSKTLEEALEEVIAISREPVEETDSVYHVSLRAFPVVQPLIGSKGEDE